MPSRAKSKPKRTAQAQADVLTLAKLKNVGPATLSDFHTLGISTVAQLAKREAFELYDELCTRTGVRHDPCVIDVFMATISQAQGNPGRVWWHFTPRRKRMIDQQSKRAASRGAKR
jgi:hypothetical protein